MVDWMFPALQCASSPAVGSTERAMRAWADLEAATCRLAWFGTEPCHAVFDAVKKSACDTQQRPVVIAAAFLSVLFTVMVILWGVTSRTIRYYTAKRGSAFVHCSIAAIRELRAQNARLYPPAAHSWTTVVDHSAPVVCYECMNPVGIRDWQSCEYCGVVVHSRCCRYVAHDCKPLTAQSDKPVHDWKPAGVLQPLMQGDTSLSGPQLDRALGLGTSSSSPQDMLALEQLCLYCQQPCEVGLFAMEPVWSCTCCHALCHMRCYVKCHPFTFSSATKAELKGQLAELDYEMACEGHTFSQAASPVASPRSPIMHGSPPPYLGGEQRLALPGTEEARPSSCPLCLQEPGTSTPPKVRSGTASPVPSVPCSARASLESRMKGSGGKSSDGRAANGPATNSVAPANGSPPSRSKRESDSGSAGDSGASTSRVRQPCPGNSPPNLVVKVSGAANAQQHGNGSPFKKAAPPALELPSVGFDADVCSLGVSGRVALPSTAVRDAGAVAAAGDLVKSSARGGRGASTSTSKRLLASGKKWWRQMHPRDRWSNYYIDPEALPPDSRPLLVFVNLKSGPQVGTTMKRQLLQLLHPLQIVELPRESPEPALRFFAPALGTRVLIIGGDGTVSWVLSCIDALGHELAEAVASGRQEALHWTAPPVAVFPMGTGNDLARCLHWGGSIAHLQHQPLPVLLEDVAVAVPTMLDRWNVRITPNTQSKRGGSLKRLFKRSIAGSGGGSARRSSLSGSDKRPQQSKVMNNYVGIGIDAKVALEFHQIRDNFPSFFQSQFGNKMWYTGVGMQDLVRRSCVGLHKRLKLVCDGVEVALPPDAEGLIIMNISCHMGGVYLWEHGLPAHPIPGAEALTAERRPLLHDEVLEVVAIGGVLHMGRLAVGLAQGQRLCQGSSITVVTHEKLPMQIDGEPWMQAPAELSISLRSRGVVLRRLPANSPAAKMASLVQEVLEASVRQGTINDSQRRALATEISAKLDHWV